MSAVAPRAAAAASPCPQPPRAAAAARPRAGGLRVRVPLRLVVGAQYSDAALSVYVKIAALAMRPEGCTARVETIAEYLGMSKSAVERALTQLRNPDPIDGVVEVPTARRTLPGGRGQSALRTVRVPDADELFVWIPVRAAEALAPRLLRLYALIAYAVARNIPTSAADLGEMLRHQTGKQAGEHLGERQARRLVDELAGLGWITVDHRAGHQGRHAYTVHRHPLLAGADIHDGSGPDSSDGSLTSREDHRTDRPLKKRRGDRSIRRRRLPQVARGPVDNPVSATFRPAVGRATDRGNSRRPLDGSGPTLSARAWAVLEPVRHLLTDATLTSWAVGRIETEISRQLAAGVGMERITARLTRRYAGLTGEVRDGARWIIGVGLPRDGLNRPCSCTLDVCEDGTLWHTKQPCGVCADLAAAAAARVAKGLPPAAPAPPPPPVPAEDWIPVPRPVPDQAAPPELTRAQRAALREAATTADVLAAVTAYGRAAAGRLYGLRLVSQALNHLDDYHPEGGPRAASQ